MKKKILRLIIVSIHLIMCTQDLIGQDIMSFDEYQKKSHPEPYVFQLERGGNSLVYFGSKHTFSLNDTQFDSIEYWVNKIQPNLILAEGGEINISGKTREEAIAMFGEMGFVHWLADRNEIECITIDPKRVDEINYLKIKGYSDVKIVLFLVLRQIIQANNQLKEIDFDNQLAPYLQSFNTRFGLAGPQSIVEFEKEVKRLLPGIENWKTPPNSLVYPGSQRNHQFTNDISTDINAFRDEYHVKVIIENLGSRKDIFVIVGSAHAVMQEPKIRFLLTK